MKIILLLLIKSAEKLLKFKNKKLIDLIATSPGILTIIN